MAEAFDLDSPEFQGNLSEEEILALGEKKKLKADGHYPFRITGTPSKAFSQPRNKKGELNPDAKGSKWIEFEATPISKDGSVSTKVWPAKGKVFMLDRLSEKAMTLVGYTEEQIAAVKKLGLPNTYGMLRQFVLACFPEEFSRLPRYNADTDKYYMNGVEVAKEEVEAIRTEEKRKVAAFAARLWANPKLITGKELTMRVTYDPDYKDPSKPSKYPSLGSPHHFDDPPKNKEGVLYPILDPNVDVE